MLKKLIAIFAIVALSMCAVISVVVVLLYLIANGYIMQYKEEVKDWYKDVSLNITTYSTYSEEIEV